MCSVVHVCSFSSARACIDTSHSLGVLYGMVACVSTCVYSSLCECTADGSYVLLLLFSVAHYIACADSNMRVWIRTGTGI